MPLDITAAASAALPRAPRTTADRCPTAIALHPAADGLIARVRLPGGRLTPAQARLLAAWAPGDDERIELTGRGNLQLRGLSADQSGPLAAALHGAGLLPSEPHDQARTLVASPVAGRLPGAVMVDAILVAIDAALCEAPELTALSGRFLTAVDDGTGAVDVAAADVALVPAGRAHPRVSGRPRPAGAFSAAAIENVLAGERFALLVGGRATGLVDAAEAPAAVIAAALAFVQAAAGTAWQVRELPDGGAAIRAALVDDGVVESLGAARVSFRRSALPPLGRGQQVDGRAFVRASSVLGRLTAAQLLAAAEAAEQGHTDLRIATDRTLTLVDLAPKHATAALERLAAAGLPVDDADPAPGLTACAGLG
ncbi:MAG: hypothetical protein AAGC46_16780, partial [Solirubrobacteraceae bacterium]|nr:hypothetical protein [Patulibacter sp.]